MDGHGKQTRWQMNYPLYNDKLAPIWNINEDGARLDDEVRKSLIKIAIDFVQDLKKNQDINIKIEKEEL